MAPPVAPLVIVQSSDWHAGSALTGKGLGFSPEFRAVRRAEVDGAAERAVLAARDAGADLLLVPGDLWDQESVPPAAIHRILEALASFAPRPVFVAPGNHDFSGPGGWYDEALLGALGMRSWPENVFVFRSPEWESRPVPGRDDATVTGTACLSPAVAAGRPLAPPPPRPGVPNALLLVHGSLETYAGPDGPVGAKRTAPFSRDELVAAGFRWAALGHHHAFFAVEGEPGWPIAAYSGAPTGRGMDEPGPRVFLKVTLPVEGPPALETIPADTRVIHDIEVDVSGLEGPAIRERTVKVLEKAGTKDADIVRLTLSGSQPFGARPALQLEPLPFRLAHLRIRDRTVAEPGEPDARTAEGRFLLDLEGRLAAAATPEERRLLESALSIGRDALAGRGVTPSPLEEF
jgi:DNA repair exonuclease SbcCD nuclease subunit